VGGPVIDLLHCEVSVVYRNLQVIWSYWNKKTNFWSRKWMQAKPGTRTYNFPMQWELL